MTNEEQRIRLRETANAIVEWEALCFSTGPKGACRQFARDVLEHFDERDRLRAALKEALDGWARTNEDGGVWFARDKELYAESVADDARIAELRKLAGEDRCPGRTDGAHIWIPIEFGFVGPGITPETRKDPSARVCHGCSEVRTGFPVVNGKPVRP